MDGDAAELLRDGQTHGHRIRPGARGDTGPYRPGYVGACQEAAIRVWRASRVGEATSPACSGTCELVGGATMSNLDGNEIAARHVRAKGDRKCACGRIKRGVSALDVAHYVTVVAPPLEANATLLLRVVRT